MYNCEFFQIFELVPPGIYRIRGEKAWSLFDDRALRTLDLLRKRFGPATINNWKWGGNFKYSGFRPQNAKIGAVYSQHRFGRAFDLKFKETAAENVRRAILANPRAYPLISAVELYVNWFHFDCRNFDNSDGIYTFKP